VHNIYHKVVLQEQKEIFKIFKKIISNRAYVKKKKNKEAFLSEGKKEKE
jgi:hypothetical protein